MSRIAPLQPPYAPEIQAQFDRIMRARSAAACCFASWPAIPAPGRNSAAAACWIRAAFVARARNRHRPHLRAQRPARYEWGVHVATFAAAAELTQEQVAPPCAAPRRCRLLVGGRAGDDRGGRCAACSAQPSTTPSSQALAAHYDETKILEIILLCGFYRTVSYLCNALALPLEERARGFPQVMCASLVPCSSGMLLAGQRQNRERREASSAAGDAALPLLFGRYRYRRGKACEAAASSRLMRPAPACG